MRGLTISSDSKLHARGLAALNIYRMRAFGILVVSIVWLTQGCSLFANYDLEGLPCDRGAQPGMECLPDSGFACVSVDGGAGMCTRKAR